MKSSWAKFWLAVSLLAFVLEASPAAPDVNTPHRANEVTLAGLRPGKTNPKETYQRFSKKWADKVSGETNSISWYEVCNWQELTVQFDSSRLVQSVTVEQVSERIIADCTDKSYSRIDRGRLGTGRDLLLKDRCDRVEEIYGKPQRESPSENGSEAVESLSYNFDWAGPKVPQSMTVLCGAAPLFQVVKITLAASKD